MNKNDKAKWERYCTSTATYLWDVYGSYSSRKAEAYEKCRKKMAEMDGFDLRIIGAGSSRFSVGWRVIENDKSYFCYTADIDSYIRKVEVEV